jgi:hypothetical protein
MGDDGDVTDVGPTPVRSTSGARLNAGASLLGHESSRPPVSKKKTPCSEGVEVLYPNDLLRNKAAFQVVLGVNNNAQHSVLIAQN